MTTWKARINKAIKTKKFTEDDKELSSSWRTCAIGEHLKLNSLDDDDPSLVKLVDDITPIMSRLGCIFEAQVYNNNPQKAMEVYKMIKKLKVD